MFAIRLMGVSLAVVVATLMFVSRGQALVPGWAGQRSAPHLSSIVRQLTRPGAVVFCAARGPQGNGGEAVKATDEVVLAPDVCAALRQAPHVLAGAYPRVSSGEAVFILAHEAGHLVRSTGEDAESQADCYAATHWRSYARALGYTKGGQSLLAQQIEGQGCWH